MESKEDTKKGSLSRINIFGYNEDDAFDFTEGVASSLFQRDIRKDWSGCIEGFPELFLSVLDVYGGFDITNPFGVLKQMQDPTKIAQVGKVMMANAMTLSGELNSCKTVAADISDYAMFGLSNFKISTISTGLVSNLTTNYMKLIGNAGGMFTAFTSHDFYLLGQNIGDLAVDLVYTQELIDHFKGIKDDKQAVLDKDKTWDEDFHADIKKDQDAWYDTVKNHKRANP